MIEIACDCGKRIRVKDEHAGKKGKCPGCGNVVRIPMSEAKPEPAAVLEPVGAAGKRIICLRGCWSRVMSSRAM